MFDQFKKKYSVTSRFPTASTGAAVASALENTPGYKEFMREYTGATFNGGVYRVYTSDGRAKWTRLIEEAYPMYRGQFVIFGCDWLGRQFALDAQRMERGQPLVELFEPSTGEALEIPADFQGFHDEFLINMSDAALCDVAFGKWLARGNRAPGPSECVGYKVPMFLGGADELENLELTDMEVYWDITAQLMARTRGLPDGTPIGKITIK